MYKCALKIQSLFILIGVWCFIFLSQYIFDKLLVLNYLSHKQNYFGAIIWISLTMHFLGRMENEQKLAQITIKKCSSFTMVYLDICQCPTRKK